MSILPDRANFKIWRGATFRKRLTIYESDGTTPRDLTDYTAELIIRDEPDGTPLLTLTTENDGIVITGASGVIDLIISASESANIDWNVGVYDLTITSGDVGGDTDALLFGTFSASGI